MKNPKGNKTALLRAKQRLVKLRYEVAMMLPCGMPPKTKKIERKLLFKRTELDKAVLLVDALSRAEVKRKKPLKGVFIQVTGMQTYKEVSQVVSKTKPLTSKS